MILKPVAGSIFILLLPLLCSYSVFWSQVPQRSLYFGLQFVSMVACTIIITRVCSLLALIKGLAYGSAAVLLIAFLSNNYQPDYFTGESLLVGYFGSKNQVGLFADVCILTTMLLLFEKKPLFLKLVPMLPLIGLGTVALYFSHSASSLLSLAAVLGVTAAAYVITRFSPKMRPILMVLGMAFVALAFFYTAIFNLDLQSATLQSVGKDATLTGRTYLWSEGIKAGLTRPWLGYGYSAFWAPGQPLAERYWSEFDITSPTGFHFHNSFIQTFVDVGVFGLLLIIGVVVGNLVISLRRLVRDGLTMETTYVLGVSCLFLIRAFVEVDFLGQYGIGTLLVYSVIPLLSRPKTASAEGPVS